MENTVLDHEKPKLSVKNIGVRFGIISLLSLVIYTLILYISGLYKYQFLSWLSYIILIAIMVAACSDFKKNNAKMMSFGQGFKIGALITLFSAGTAVFNFIYLKFIDDSSLLYAWERAEENMELRGMSDEQIDSALDMVGKFMTPEMIAVFGALGMTFLGIILSLIVAAVMKKSNALNA